MNPIHLNGVLQRTDDVGMFKHQADQKAGVDQQNIQTQVVKHEQDQSHRVLDPGDSDKLKNQADARDEGKGAYYTPSQNRKKKKENEKDVKVTKKITPGGFDIKI